ncbi:MAG: TadE/TadG family type IV pilus assembly protein [Actinomycetota bacterium]
MGGCLKGRARDRGAVLTEAAIVTPLFVMLLFGIWTTARAWNVHNVLDHAAREAARYGAVDPTHTEIQIIAQGELAASAISWSEVDLYCAAVVDSGVVNNNSGGNTLCLTAGEDPTTDDRVQVQVEIQDYPLAFVYFTIDVDLSAKAVARLEP